MLIVEDCADSGFIAKATEKMKIYRTPKAIVDYIKRHEVIIGNPPFMGGDRRGKNEKN